MNPRFGLVAATVSAEVATAFSLRPKQLKLRCRKQPIAWARQIAMYLIRSFTNEPQRRCGAVFGLNNATVCYSETVVRERASVYPRDADQIAEIQNNVRRKLRAYEKTTMLG